MASLIAINSYNTSKDIENQLRVVAFLKQPSNPEKNLKLLEKIEQSKHVVEVEYISKDEALASLDKQMKNSEVDVEESLKGENPLPDSFQITVDQPENIEKIAKMVEKQEIIDEVKYGQDLVENIVSFNKSATVVGVIVIALLTIATLFLINITIQLTVNSRKDEIQIMKLVGAKNSFIRMPFFIEGMLLGAIGALLAGAFVYWGYANIYEYINANMPFMPMFNNNYMMIGIIIFNLVIGIILGAIGSVLAVRKHLKI